MVPEDDSLQMHLLHDYNSPMKSGVLYKQLLGSLCSEDIKLFRSLLEQSYKKDPTVIDVNHVYPNQSEETCLDIACRKGLPAFVQLLLDKGANVNRVNKVHNRGPIHFATEKGYQDVLQVLLKDPRINPNLEAGQRTALHMAVKKNDLACAQLLLEKGASPNIPNNKGWTAIHMAAMNGQTDMVQLIFDKSTHVLDFDRYKDHKNQSTRDVLAKIMPDLRLPPPVQNNGANVHDLKYYLNVNDETNFLNCLEVVEDDVVNNVAEDLMEMAVRRDFKDAVSALLKRVREAECNLPEAAKLAVQKGLPDVLRRILSTDVQVGNKLLMDACVELGIPGKGSEGTADRLECLRLILEREEVDVRCTDNKGNTPLHYAARADCREAVTMLLEKGSYIGHMNTFGVPPVADISVSTLSGYFDDCIQARKERTNEYIIEFDYKCLMPHDTPHMEGQASINQQKREMDIFQYIANSTDMKHLLKHPLLSSFLYMKWRRIRHILFLNFAFYLLLYCLLNSYILLATYNPINNMNASNSSEAEMVMESGTIGVLRILASIALVFLGIREFLQLVSSPCYYVSNCENWLEVTLLILGFSALYGADSNVAAVVVLLSAWELVILIGQHPRMSTDIEMFKTVSVNFLRFLFLYTFLILAFANAFFVLFKDNENFLDPGNSLFKTIIMLTGEFEANEIPFVSHPVMSHLVFVSFVFFIAIVLFNLLNGLAVSDTAEILDKAELVGLISRIRLVSYVEIMAISAPLLHGPHCLLCHGFSRGWSCRPLTFLADKILIFPDYLKDGKLSVKPYDSLETFGNIDYKKPAGEAKDRVFPVFKMDRHVMKQAKEILAKRGRESDTERMINELEGVKERLALIDITLNALKLGLDNNNVNARRDD
ncbi:transient receptor potential cation channel family member painless [Nomia melanderi]|uniref:transient receptor potential cation channel family member painless n=1 Tax=Nomia melanderi TaxID=2448451 RepID=UPI003FCC9DBC